jgi:glycolate oxidase iron-sulfur subunit
LLRAVIEGRLEWPGTRGLYTCLLCGACTSNCFPARPTSELVITARAEYLEKVGRKSIHHLLFDKLLPYPRRLHLAARAVALGKNSGMSELARALGLLRIFGRDLSRAEAMVDRLPAQPFRARFKPGVFDGQGRSQRVAYFVGCGIDVVSHAAGEATLALLRRFSRSVRVLDNNCCGLPAWSYGDLAAARKLAGKNLPVLEAGSVDAIVTDCSSCTGFIKKYPRLFSEDDSQSKAAQSVAARARDVSGGLRRRSSVLQALQGKRHLPRPCHASRGQGLVKQPRELLRRMPARSSLSFRRRTGAAAARVPMRSPLRPRHAGPGPQDGKPEEDRRGCARDYLPGLHDPAVVWRAAAWNQCSGQTSDRSFIGCALALKWRARSGIFDSPCWILWERLPAAMIEAGPTSP